MGGTKDKGLPGAGPACRTRAEVGVKSKTDMALLLDTENMIMTDADDMAQQLIRLLDDSPDEETLVYLAAAVLGCDVLGVIITHTERP